MYAEGRAGRGDAAELAEVIDPKWMVRHSGRLELVARYRRWAARCAARKLAGLREAAPFLLGFISDERTLYCAYKHLEEWGSHAPGPDGVRYEEIALFDEWKWCRELRDTIRKGYYELGPERLQRVSKGSGRGYRDLVVQSIDARVVQRAAVEVLQPLLDPLFDPRSFGFRPKMGPLLALATAEKLCQAHGLEFWVSADIRNAFPSVPFGRLLGVVRKYLPDDGLVKFVKTITLPDKTPGLRQGSPLSPLLLNLYLHHHLDRKWRAHNPNIPLLRFADDILLLCRTAEDARTGYAALTRLLRAAGFKLKEGENDAIREISAGRNVKWMGFEIKAGPDGLRFNVTDDAWDSLADKFETAHSKPLSPLAAVHSLTGWVSDKGPCYLHTNVDRAYSRISRFAAAQGFEEIPEKRRVAKLWQGAHARWCKLRKRIARSDVAL